MSNKYTAHQTIKIIREELNALAAKRHEWDENTLANLVEWLDLTASYVLEDDDEEEDAAATEYCDHCGEPSSGLDLVCYDKVPWNVASANKGESATLCPDCVSNFKAHDKAENKS